MSLQFSHGYLPRNSKPQPLVKRRHLPAEPRQDFDTLPMRVNTGRFGVDAVDRIALDGAFQSRGTLLARNFDADGSLSRGPQLRKMRELCAMIRVDEGSLRLRIGPS